MTTIKTKFMPEQISPRETADTKNILDRLFRVAHDHTQDEVDEELANLAKQAFQTSEEFREGLYPIIGAMLEKDWYGKAEKFASACGMSDADFIKLTKRYKPNPRLIV